MIYDDCEVGQRHLSGRAFYNDYNVFTYIIL